MQLSRFLFVTVNCHLCTSDIYGIFPVAEKGLEIGMLGQGSGWPGPGYVCAG